MNPILRREKSEEKEGKMPSTLAMYIKPTLTIFFIKQ